MTTEKEECGAKRRFFGLGLCNCTLPAGHSGVHEDEPIGVWWPRQEREDNW